MPRNFDRRVEAVAPVDDPALHTRLRSLFDTCLRDNRQAWDLESDGTWRQRVPTEEVRATHSILLVDSWGLVPPSAAAESPYKAQALAEGRSGVAGDD
jgi:polyphosphate kinase